MGKTDEELKAKRDQLIARDMDQVAQVKTFGVDLAAKRQIDLTFWAPNQEAALVFKEACQRNEMPPHTFMGPGDDEKNRRWLIRCAFHGSVEFVTNRENLVTFLLFADKFDCEYDGWGAAIVEAASSPEPF